MRAMSTAALPIRSIERDHLEHRGHRLGLLRVAGGQHRHGPHVVHEVGHLVLELVDLLGHVGVAEVEGGVGQVDHQLRQILGFGEHGPEVAGFGVHRVPRGYDASRGVARAAGGLVHTVPVRRRPLLSLVLAGPGRGRGHGLLGDRRPHAAAGRSQPDHHHPERAGDPAAHRRGRRVHAGQQRLRRRRGHPRAAHLHRRRACRPTCRGPARRSTRSSWRSSCATGTPAGFVHWVVTGIDPFVQGVGEGGHPGERRRGPNGAGAVGWLGPVPAGGQRHPHLRGGAARPPGGRSTVPPDATGEETAALVEASASERAVLTGTVTAG